MMVVFIVREFCGIEDWGKDVWLDLVPGSISLATEPLPCLLTVAYHPHMYLQAQCFLSCV